MIHFTQWHGAGVVSSPSGGARCATKADLPAINAVVEQAVMGWPLGERIKALSLPLLRYQDIDMDDFEFLLWETQQGAVGVAAWAAAAPTRTGDGRLAALLHGLYVKPGHQQQGVGRNLQAVVCQHAQVRGIELIVVKAERVAVSYFERCDYERVPGGMLARCEYPHLFWRSTENV